MAKILSIVHRKQSMSRQVVCRGLLTMLLAWTCSVSWSQGLGAVDSLVMKRMFAYRTLHGGDVEGLEMNVYMKSRFKTVKKNRLLLAVPSMYAFSRRGEGVFVGETYLKVKFNSLKDHETVKHVTVGTVPRYRQTLPTLAEWLTPNLYNVTLMEDHLLSPFHGKNAVFYRYGMSYLEGLKARLAFVPRMGNTQLVSGMATIDCMTGRIEEVEMQGEYDMVTFKIKALMGEEGAWALIPKTCELSATFHVLGNRIEHLMMAEYGLPITLPDTLMGSHSRALMDSLRPIPLTLDEERMYAVDDSIETVRAAMPKRKRKWNFAKDVLWDVLGDNMVNRIKGRFGSSGQGSYRISPILNPLYLGYTGKKGFTYKFNLRGSYDFNENKELSARFKGGYSFKQKQFYFNLPVTYTFNNKRNGFIRFELGNGNRITNSSVKDRVIEEQLKDSAELEKMELDYFSDNYYTLRGNYDVSNRWSLGGGLAYHRRSAVNRKDFYETGLEDTYHTTAPFIETQIRPWGWSGPIFTVNYERSMRGLLYSDMNYGRLEADAVWQLNLSRLRSLSMRLGGGVYTVKDKKTYFVDFDNFRDDNTPGGWNDDWTGEFQLLESAAYNKSDYYFRTNMTYESPLLLLSHIPGLGRYMEMERVYFSTLLSKGIHPYVEMGYGMTNRIFSTGVFVAMRNHRYDGIGFRVGLELFRDW